MNKDLNKKDVVCKKNHILRQREWTTYINCDTLCISCPVNLRDKQWQDLVTGENPNDNKTVPE